MPLEFILSSQFTGICFTFLSQTLIMPNNECPPLAARHDTGLERMSMRCKSGTTIVAILSVGLSVACSAAGSSAGWSYAIVDTGQGSCFGRDRVVRCPGENGRYSGQDAQYVTNTPSYRDNRDGTITDRHTGLVWQKTPDPTRRNQTDSERFARNLKLAGFNDWRLPTIKELFSIADFKGDMHSRIPYIDPVFDFQYPTVGGGGNGQPGQRDMDAQFASSTRYLGTTMGRDQSAFGFNFADGRIKGYPLRMLRYVRAVRGNPDYGKNRFHDNRDGTITDRATGLTWLQADSGKTMNWPQALEYAQSSTAAGKNDWRLPNVKELQSIVDYNSAPDSRDPSRRAPAIDSRFKLSVPESWFWSSTTHVENGFAYYVAFGQAFSARKRAGKQINAHGAGAVRSDPKQGRAERWSDGLGPQADEIRIDNYVRLVRGGGVRWSGQGQPELSTAAVGSKNARPSQQPGRDPGARFIQRLDSNGDGKVSKREFDGPMHHFGHMDRNGDGYLDTSEAPKGPPPGRGRRRDAGDSGGRPAPPAATRG